MEAVSVVLKMLSTSQLKLKKCRKRINPIKKLVSVFSKTLKVDLRKIEILLPFFLSLANVTNAIKVI